jgi:catalase
VDDDCYSQAGALFRLMNESQKQQLFKNIAASIASVPDDIKRKQLEHFSKADRPTLPEWLRRWICRELYRMRFPDCVVLQAHIL